MALYVRWFEFLSEFASGHIWTTYLGVVNSWWCKSAADVQTQIMSHNFTVFAVYGKTILAVSFP